MIKTINILLASLLFLLAGSRAEAQSDKEITEYISWIGVSSTIKFHKYIGLATDAQFRFVRDFDNMQHMVRLGPEVYITKNFSIVPAGYAYVWNFSYERDPLPYAENEHRIWEQLQYKHKAGRVQFQHRLRFEQRFIQTMHYDSTSNTVVDEGYTRYRNRIRYRFLVNVPLKSKSMDRNTWYLQFWNEYFFSFAKGIDPNDNHQNRLFAGAGYQVTKGFTFNLGFLYHMQMKRNGNLTEHNFGPLLSITYNPDLSAIWKKKKEKGG